MNYAKTLRRHVYHPGTFSISSSTGEVKLERSLDVTVSRRYLLEAQVSDGLHLAQVSTVPGTQCAHLETRRHFSRMPAARFLDGLCVCVCVCVWRRCPCMVTSSSGKGGQKGPSRSLYGEVHM